MATVARLTGAAVGCLVLVQGNGQSAGSGFLVAPGYVVTCAHVVGSTVGAPVTVRRRDVDIPGRVLAASPAPVHTGVWPYPDLAIVQLDGPGEDHPCAWWHDRIPMDGQRLSAVGHSDKYRSIPEPLTSTFRYHGEQSLDGGRMLRLKWDEITPGMSGGPVLNLATGGVCAVVKATRMDDSDMGGLATPIGALRLLDPVAYRALVRAHDVFHGGHQGWPGAPAGEASVPGAMCIPPRGLRKLFAMLAEAPAPAPEVLSAAFRCAAGRHAEEPTLPVHEHRDVISELDDLGVTEQGVPLAFLHAASVARELPDHVGELLRSWVDLLGESLGLDGHDLVDLLKQQQSTRFGALPARGRAGGNGWVDSEWARATVRSLADAEPSRSPILIAVDTDRDRLTDAEFSTTHRHMTVTLRAEQAERIEVLAHDALGTADSVDRIVTAGSGIWAEFLAAQPRLAGLLDRIDDAGFAQPVAWCGKRELLDRLRTALLIAHTGTARADGFLSVRTAGHYFMPVHDSGESRRMKHRSGRGHPDVRLLDLRSAEPERRMTLLGGSAVAEVVVVVDPDDASSTVPTLAEIVRREPVSPTRAAFVFGRPVPGSDAVDELLDTVPFVALADGDVAEPALLDALRDALREHAGTRALPCIVAAIRSAWIRRAVEREDLVRCLSGLTWSVWSWIGLPLFAQQYGEVLPAAFPHLMDLRAVMSGDWYFNRRKGIPAAYEADALAGADLEQKERFHLYLSGAGGTGKSCLLRYVHDQIDERSNAIAVWYRVDAPSSLWGEVEKRIREETVAAVRRKLGDAAAASIARGGAKLGTFLREAAKRLRQQDRDFDEIVIFLDQLERTFESGDEPDFERLDTISGELVQLLKTVRVGQGVRIFVASRKQYLPDFLGSSRTAMECGLEFNVLQTIADSAERAEFVRSIFDWCTAQELVDPSLVMPPDSAKNLAERVKGHPLNTTLALIQLLSANLRGRITEADLHVQRPWERLFALDLQAAARDDLDWYFLLAMAHARTEIVRFEEVWWRLRMVDPRLTRRVDELRRDGILERLWLFGHLGRTIHARPYGGDPARFLEFFHANLRDFLLRDVMTQGGSDLDISGRRGGTPPAWRALDRLAVYAHDWEQTQQLLPLDDISVLMEHRAEVIEPHASVGEVEPSFHLLFLRDPVPARAWLSEAAMECFVFSALVHENGGRWAFETLFPDADQRVELCRRWLARCSSGTRPAVLRYFVELEGPSARDALSALVLDDASPLRDDIGQALADVLAEPLYAARYRNAVMAALLGAALRPVHGDLDRLPPRVASFAVMACEGDRDTLTRVLAYCGHRLGADDMGSVPSPASPTPTSLADRWLREAGTNAGYTGVSSVDRSAGAIGSFLGLAVGSNLLASVTAERVAEWSRDLRERIGVTLPDIRLVSGDSLADEIELGSPRGRLSTGIFHPECSCVLKRQWEAKGAALPGEALEGLDDASGEVVLWLPEAAVPPRYPGSVRDFDTAVADWLEAHCRRSFGLLFDMDLQIGLAREMAALHGVRSRLRMDELRRLRQVVLDLVEESVPFAPRRQTMLEELSRLLPEARAEVLTQTLREHLQTDICRSVADESGQFTTVLLDEPLEQMLADRVGLSGERTILRLSPAEAQDLAAAVRRRVHGVLPAPVLVTLPALRPSLSRLLRRFDHRLRVLSFTELDPEFITVPGDLVRVPGLSGGST